MGLKENWVFAFTAKLAVHSTVWLITNSMSSRYDLTKLCMRGKCTLTECTYKHGPWKIKRWSAHLKYAGGAGQTTESAESQAQTTGGKSTASPDSSALQWGIIVLWHRIFFHQPLELCLQNHRIYSNSGWSCLSLDHEWVNTLVSAEQVALKGTGTGAAPKWRQASRTPAANLTQVAHE